MLNDGSNETSRSMRITSSRERGGSIVNEAKFTKGPWMACLNVLTATIPGHIIKTDYGVNRPIASVPKGGGTEGKPQQEANAYLMAAAPKMYEALEDAKSKLNQIASLLNGKCTKADRFQAFSLAFDGELLAALSIARGEKEEVQDG